MSQRARGVIFGDDAVAYERSRPGYPDAAIEHIVGLIPATSAVEIGAGTGKATASLARPGLDLTCIEPSSEMAAVLAAKELPGVDVIVSGLEEWSGPAHRVDLVYAAQAWHWVDRSVGYDKVRSMLRPGGAVALMWNIPDDRYGDFRDIYQRLAPHLLGESDERIERRDSHDWLADLAVAGFDDLQRFEHRWAADLTAAEFRSLYATYSDHMMLPEPGRAMLLDELETAVLAQGGKRTLEYRTLVFSGTA
jgi:SAM-dependent methyltransferase